MNDLELIGFKYNMEAITRMANSIENKGHEINILRGEQEKIKKEILEKMPQGEAIPYRLNTKVNIKLPDGGEGIIPPGMYYIEHGYFQANKNGSSIGTNIKLLSPHDLSTLIRNVNIVA